MFSKWRTYSQRLTLGLAMSSCSAGALAVCPPDSTAPSFAQAVGYCAQTFPSSPTSAAFSPVTVDVANCRSDDYDWYAWQFFESNSNVADMSLVEMNGDGSVTIHGEDMIGVLTTAAPGTTTPGSFVGTAFGGGAYFEATLKIGNVAPESQRSWWPAFWSMAIGHLAGLPEAQWPGQHANYKHFAEADFMEHYFAYSSDKRYLGAMHDWYGCSPTTSGCTAVLDGTNVTGPVRYLPAGTDFTQFHRYGFLWIPATATTNGSATYYFDGQAVGTDTWSKYGNEPPPPVSPWKFGIIDEDHLPLILNAGVNHPPAPGTLAPVRNALGLNEEFYPYQDMTVQSVKVWQASTSENLTGQASQSCICTYSLSGSSTQRNLLGGSAGSLTDRSGQFQVSTVSASNLGCAWKAKSHAAWLTITGGTKGQGNGTVTYQVARNTGPARTGIITAAGHTFTVNQAGVP